MFTAALVVALVGTALGLDCRLSLQNINPQKEPLILGVRGKDLDFVWPVSEACQYVGGQSKKARLDPGVLNINVKDGGELLFTCPGKRNFQMVSGKQTATANCSNGSLLIQGSKRVTTDTTSCSKTAESTLQVAKGPIHCGSGKNTGVIVQLGYQLETSFHSLVGICQNSALGVSYYAKHDVHGASLDAKVIDNRRPSFTNGHKDVSPPYNPNKVYTQESQIETFENILGKGAATKYIVVPESKYLAKGHLAPDADFIYRSGQLLTYKFSNVAPQWQSFNNGNWKSIEIKIRDIAKQVCSTIKVITGTYGILELPDMTKKPQKIFLAPNKLLPVPQLFWKVLQNPKTNSCLVIIGVNNPFLTSAPTRICTTVNPNGWPNLTSDFKKGYVYYCDYASFKKVVDYVPDLTCRSILNF